MKTYYIKYSNICENKANCINLDQIEYIKIYDFDHFSL